MSTLSTQSPGTWYLVTVFTCRVLYLVLTLSENWITNAVSWNNSLLIAEPTENPYTIRRALNYRFDWYIYFWNKFNIICFISILMPWITCRHFVIFADFDELFRSKVKGRRAFSVNFFSRTQSLRRSFISNECYLSFVDSIKTPIEPSAGNGECWCAILRTFVTQFSDGASICMYNYM